MRCLHFAISCDIVSMVPHIGYRALHNGRRFATPPERGDGHANYIDLSHSALDCDDQSKKQKPPLGKVTVSRLILDSLS